VKLAIFDLDNTLIGGDSDCLWGQFLGDHHYIDSASYQSKHDEFYKAYLAGDLDIHEFLAFQLKPLSENDISTLLAWRDAYLEEMIRPIILPKARMLVEDHRSKGHELLIITATNRFLTEPITAEFNIQHLIACEPEMQNGQYTGKVIGIPSYAQGKVTRLQEWITQQPNDIDETWFYSDSHNDIPLLEQVEHPVAVDPDDQLRETAIKNNWPIMSLR